MTFALQEFNREGANVISRTEAIGQSLMMTGSKFGAVGGSMVQLGIALNEVFTGTQAAARAMAEEVAAMESKSRFQAETRDLERQLAILKETDPVRKAELEMQRELAKIRREALELDGKGADAAARDMIRAKEALAIEQGRQKIEAARAAQDSAKAQAGGAVGSLVDTLTTSIGNTFRVATRGAAAAMQQQQTQLQQTISGNVASILSMMRSQSGVIA
jgi:non-homologous end joining protein Ku